MDLPADVWTRLATWLGPRDLARMAWAGRRWTQLEADHQTELRRRLRPGMWALAGVAGDAGAVVGVTRVQSMDDAGVLLCRYMQSQLDGRYREWRGPTAPNEGLICVNRHRVAWRVLRLMWVGSGPAGYEWVDSEALDAAMPTWIERGRP